MNKKSATKNDRKLFKFVAGSKSGSPAYVVHSAD